MSGLVFHVSGTETRLCTVYHSICSSRGSLDFHVMYIHILYYNYTHFNPLRKASQLHDSLASCYTVAYRTVCHQSQTYTITTKKHPLFREIDLAHQSVT